MGRGFGRGAKTVAVVTHAQVKGKGKLPRGLRGNRKKKRKMYARANDEQAMLETSMGVGENPSQKTQKKQHQETGVLSGRRTMAQEIASIQFQSNVKGRRKGFKLLRKHLLESVKDLRRKHHEKATKMNAKAKISTKQIYAHQYAQAVEKNRGGRRREESSDDDEDLDSEMSDE